MIDADSLIEEYVEMKRYVEEEKPYWMNLTGGTSFGGPLRFELENYFPGAHYKKAIDQVSEEEARDRVRTDGGRQTQYYWVGETGVLYHSEIDGDLVNPFFDTMYDAEQFLESQAEQHGEERYSGMVLRKTGHRKVEEATEVLTSQSGLTDW